MRALWRRLRLRAQILITLMALLFVSLLVIYFVVRGLNRTALVRERLSGATETAALAADLARGVPADPGKREAFVATVAARSTVRAALLVDEHLEVIAPQGMQPFWSPRDAGKLRQMMSSGRPAFRYPQGTEQAPLWVLMPVARRSGRSAESASDSESGPAAEDAAPRAPEIAGVGLYFFADEPLAQRVLGERLLLLFLVCIIGLLAVVAHLALTRLVVQPVRTLIRTVDRVAAHDLRAIRLPEGRRGSELRALSESVDSMLERLREDKGRIELSVERLKRMNARLVKAQESLVRSEKLASVGQLAAGVAHEIGNPISIVLGYLEILQQGGVSEERRKEYLTDIQEATDRINNIIRDLLDFARPSKEEATHALLPRVIENSIKLLRPQKKFREVDVSVETLDIEGSGTETPFTAHMNEGRLQQVLVNLLMNAADAMGGRGCIVVRTRDCGARVRIEVHDEGPGIPKAQQRRIFDPFYTTKDPGEGTGLGLAICYSLVAAFDGEIAVSSQPGDGATFLVELWKPEHAPPDTGRGREHLSLLDSLDVSLDEEEPPGPSSSS